MTYQNAREIAATSAPAMIAERSLLTAAVSSVAAIVERRSIPILQNLKIQGDGQAVFIIGTDLDLELCARIPAAADSRMAITLPAHDLQSFLKKASASEFAAITAQPQEDDDEGPNPPLAHVEFDRVSFDLKTLPVTDFPALNGPAHNEAHRFTMSGGDLFTALTRTIGAISTEETRYYLNGVFMHCRNGKLRLVATDGHRLYMQEFDAPEFMTDDLPAVIIPRKTIATLHKMAKGKAQPESFAIEVTDCKIRFTWDGLDGVSYVLTSKLIDGTFPDYQRVIPMHNNKRMRVDVAALQAAIGDASLVSSERGRAVKLTVTDGKCIASVNNPDKGRALAEIRADYSSEALEIGFNAKYVTEILKTCEGETATFEFADAGSPTRITCDAEGWSAVLMPMRV